MTLRTLLILINVAAVVVILVILGAKVLSVRREPNEKSPSNQTPFYADDVLEDGHLTRVLRWALLFSTITAIVLPLYWLLEPERQAQETSGFERRAIEQGEVLYANKAMEAFDSAKSLACADCHGVDGSGGSKNWVLTPAAQGDTAAAPIDEVWVAPALNDIFYRFTEDPVTGVAQISQVITYGRPGTPMPAWGVAGGGAKNVQAVSDLVAYLRSIQVSPAKARAQATKQVKDFQTSMNGQEASAEKALANAEKGLAAAKTQAQRDKYTGEIEAARVGITRSREYAAQVGAMGQGELLFNTQCARCHTKGWSTLEPSNGFVPMPSAPGIGRYGPNLRGGSTVEQFPGAPGKESHYDWVAIGVEDNKGYGTGGISSGRMPHFGEILTRAQIEAIIEFERSL